MLELPYILHSLFLWTYLCATENKDKLIYKVIVNGENHTNRICSHKMFPQRYAYEHNRHMSRWVYIMIIRTNSLDLIVKNVLIKKQQHNITVLILWYQLLFIHLKKIKNVASGNLETSIRYWRYIRTAWNIISKTKRTLGGHFVGIHVPDPSNKLWTNRIIITNNKIRKRLCMISFDTIYHRLDNIYIPDEWSHFQI
jgi:hypothetical protein